MGHSSKWFRTVGSSLLSLPAKSLFYQIMCIMDNLLAIPTSYRLHQTTFFTVIILSPVRSIDVFVVSLPASLSVTYRLHTGSRRRCRGRSRRRTPQRRLDGDRTHLGGQQAPRKLIGRAHDLMERCFSFSSI